MEINNDKRKPLQVHRLVKRFGDIAAVDSLSFEVDANIVTVLLGPNGSGKTTLLRMICGLLQPDSGTIDLYGHRCGFPIHSREFIGYCPQRLSLWRDLSCREQLLYLADIYGVAKKQRMERVQRLIDNLELTDKANTLAGKLSGGMQRRLNLALAMIHQPRLLILDEPFNGLDIMGRLLVRRLILSLAHEKNRSVILSTHDIHDAEQFADQVCIVHKGKVLDQNSPTELKKHLGHRHVIKIRFSAADNDILSAIQRIVSEIAPTGVLKENTLVLKAADPGVLIKLLRELNNRGIEATTISSHEPTLEDVFIRLTESRLTREAE